MKLVHWPLMGGLLHLVQRGGDWAGPSPPRPLLAVPNVTAHPSTASVPITVLLCNGPLLCRFNVGIIGLTTAWVSAKTAVIFSDQCFRTVKFHQMSENIFTAS